MKKPLLMAGLIVVFIAIIIIIDRQLSHHSTVMTVPSGVPASGDRTDTVVSDPVKDSILRAQAVNTFKRKWCRGLVCPLLVNRIIVDSVYSGLRGYRSMELKVIRAEYSKVIVSNDFSMTGQGGKITRHSVLAVMDTSGKLVQWLRKR